MNSFLFQNMSKVQTFLNTRIKLSKAGVRMDCVLKQASVFLPSISPCAWDLALSRWLSDGGWRGGGLLYVVPLYSTLLLIFESHTLHSPMVHSLLQGTPRIPHTSIYHIVQSEVSHRSHPGWSSRAHIYVWWVGLKTKVWSGGVSCGEGRFSNALPTVEIKPLLDLHSLSGTIQWVAVLLRLFYTDVK